MIIKDKSQPMIITATEDTKQVISKAVGIMNEYALAHYNEDKETMYMIFVLLKDIEIKDA
jgi:hypothetical protein